MRHNLIILAVVFALAAIVSWAWQGREPVAPPSVRAGIGDDLGGSAAPAFSFTDLEGETQDIAAFQDLVIILNFWATWCLPCGEEFPRLLELAAEKGDRVVLIALSADEDPAKIPAFLARLGESSQEKLERANVIIGHDRGKRISQDLFQTYRLPETILIGPGLRMSRKIAGANWKTEELGSVIDALLQPGG